MLEQKNCTIAAELKKLRELQESGAGTVDNSLEMEAPVQYSANKYSETDIPSTPTNQKHTFPKLPAKSEQGARKTPSSTSALKQPARHSSSAVMKQVTTYYGEVNISCEPVSASSELKKGQRVVVSRSSGSSNEYGTVRVVNVSINMKPGFIGIEMDLPSMFLYILTNALLKF